MYLTVYVDEYGVKISSKENLLVFSYNASQRREEIAAQDIHSILISQAATITSGAFKLLEQHSIFVIWSSYKRGMVLMPFFPIGTAKIRRGQYAAINNESGIVFAKNIIISSMENRRWILWYLQKYKSFETRDRRRDIDFLVEKLKKKQITQEEIDKRLRGNLMARESEAAKIYFSQIKESLPSSFLFIKRTRRPATDIFSALLNYGYAILLSRITSHALASGLDIYAGILHVDRPGRPAFSLDMIEEFRQPIVDYCALNLLFDKKNREILDTFLSKIKPDEEVKLNKIIKKKYLTLLHERLTKKYKEKTFEQWIMYQMRHASLFFRRDVPLYSPFTMRVIR